MCDWAVCELSGGAISLGDSHSGFPGVKSQQLNH